MSRPVRKRLDLDYGILHRTGKRVYKDRNNIGNMEELQVKAININSDVEDLFSSYSLEDLLDEDDLSSYIDELKIIKKEYRRTHALLKSSMGEAFPTSYPDFEKNVFSLDKQFKLASKKLAEIKKGSKEETGQEKVHDDVIKERKQILSDRKFLIDQINWEITGCDFEKILKVDEVKSQIEMFRLRLDKFQDISSKLDVCFSPEDHGLQFENADLIKELRNLLGVGAHRLISIDEESRRVENEKLEKQEVSRLAQAEAEEQKKNNEILSCANELFYEIDMRHLQFLKKMKIDLSELDDFEILELKKHEGDFDVELREIIEKVVGLRKFVLPCGPLAKDICDSATKKCNECNSAMTEYIKKISEIIAERDISEKKLNNSAGLKIELKKFSGYDSPMDVFTFKSEFKKLVEPFVQKTLWADYLKNNCLLGTALSLVSKLDDITQIWGKLVEVYGDTALMLHKKLLSLEKLPNMEKVTDDGKIANTMVVLLNTISDLRKLAADYSLENELYYGVGLQKILDILGLKRRRKFTKLTSLLKLGGREKWDKLVEFLSSELHEREAYILDEKIMKCASAESRKEKSVKDEFKGKGSNGDGKSGFLVHSENSDAPPKCFICGKSDDHVLSYDENKKPYVEYIACKEFSEKTPKQRNQMLFKKRLCCKCLTPGAKYDSEHVCDKIYACKQTYVKNGKELQCVKHVLVCGYHCNEESNAYVLEKYKKNVIRPHGKFLDFSKNISISCFSESYNNLERSVSNDTEEDPDRIFDSIFLFQPINVSGVKLNIFYDSGCGDLVISKRAVEKLENIGRASQTQPGPLILNGVNNQKSVCEYGAYRIRIPLAEGTDAHISGICVDDVTSPFPFYQLKGIEADFRAEVRKKDKNILSKLPKLSKEVGGKVDIMLGKHYLKYFPREIVRLTSGLTMYESVFLSSDRTRGVIAGPHPKFTIIHKSSNFVYSGTHSYYTPTVKNYIEHSNTVAVTPLLGNKYSVDTEDVTDCFDVRYCHPGYLTPPNDHGIPSFFNGGIECSFGDPSGGMGLYGQSNVTYLSKRGPKCLKKFELIEKSGTEVSYRCMDCRNCKQCLQGAQIEEISMQEEMEQNLIEKNVTVNINKKCASTNMPFTADPDSRLVTNDREARKIFDSQVKKLNKCEKDRLDALASEQKLQDLGYVDWFSNLDPEDQKFILECLVRYFIPWAVVWSKSLSTPLRTVFNASFKTASGYSLNDILPKGKNLMNILVVIIIRWSIKEFAYHTDVRKMYNSILMNKTFWRFQLYWWSKSLKPDEKPAIKVIKTCIYGVKCSGNQAESALRKIAQATKDKFPKAYDVIMNDLYVDDCLSGEVTEEDRTNTTEDLKLSLEEGGFTLKGFTFSGEDPDVNLSEDGKSVLVGGLRWFPKEDYFMLNIGKINFSPKIRGRKLESKNNLPEKLTLRNCASVAGEVFDPLGRTVPVMAGIKLDISLLHKNGFSWDDELPENFRSIWANNFEMIQELGSLKYNRVIVPDNAKSLDIVTLDFGDASATLICVAIYARFELKDGSHSCHLVFSRSKIIPEGTTTPRAELMAASMNATTGYTVQKAFGNYHKAHLKLTDSTVTLHWISSQKTALKSWVRGHVIEVNRLSDRNNWRHVEGSKNPADLGTRKGAKISEITEDSFWIKGFPWMSKIESEFPIRTLAEISMSKQDVIEADKEMIILKTFHSQRNTQFDQKFDDQVKLRYTFSNYLIDPNKFRFRKVVRIMAIVIAFVIKVVPRATKLLILEHQSPNDLPPALQNVNDKFIVTSGSGNDMHCKAGLVVEISEQMLKYAFNYFILKASSEVKKFVDKRKYVNISREVDGILYYDGRILPQQEFQGYPEICGVALDLCSTTFCVPVMDQYSPVAISIALETHWFHPDVAHRGIETTVRQLQLICQVIGGSNLMVLIKKGCKRCRILNKKSIDLAMGPVQNVNLCIAPAFYATQVDIFGPFKCYSPANKRATLKVWFLIFCCCTTGAINIRAMEDYSTDAFVLGFVRFSCQFGYPKYLLPDAGSQLVKGCEDMVYTYSDAKEILATEYGVQYYPCPVGAHYMHGKVERKIREVKKSVEIKVQNERLSLIQWETLMAQISNSINNMPIGLKNKSANIEQLDLITPNRLLMGRNNERSPNKPLVLCPDHKKVIESNANIFKAWFNSWIVSYVPTLVERSKWHTSLGMIQVGDIVLFLKSEKEYDLQYQYGIVIRVFPGKDGINRKVEVEYRNFNEGNTRKTQRGARELVVVYPVDELDINERLSALYENCI